MVSAVPVLLPVQSLDTGKLEIDGKNIYRVERREKKKSIQLEYSKKPLTFCWRNKYKDFE